MYKNKTIIQIGSHVGKTLNDPIYNKVDIDTTLFLIEPVPYLFNELKKNYSSKNVKNIHFINKAVSNKIGNLELTIPSQDNDFSKFPFWASQLSSTNNNHISTHLSNLKTEKLIVESTTIDEIIKEFNIRDIELLHTDTEGHDYEILNSYSFVIKPKYILFEHKHMDGTFIVGMNYRRLIKKLKSLGYIWDYKSSDDTMFKLPDTDL